MILARACRRMFHGTLLLTTKSMSPTAGAGVVTVFGVVGINRTAAPLRIQASGISIGKAFSGSASATETRKVKNEPDFSDILTNKQVQEKSKFIGMTGGEIFHEKMLEHKVSHIFGYPGGAILPVFNAIYKSKCFKFILPRNEQGCGHMAEGYARATGKPGVALVTSGPGATNLVTSLQDALMDGVPLVAFTGQVPTFLMGSDAFQEADIVGITRPCTKWNVIVNNVEDLPRLIDQAFEIALTGRPGPVLVDLPKDVTATVLEEEPTGKTIAPYNCVQNPSDAKFNLDADLLQEVVRLINIAEKPVIYAGQGVISSNTSDMLRAISKKANIPVTTTLQGMGAFDELDDLSLHMLGMHGSAYANYAMQNADLVISIGARFDDRVTGNLEKFAPTAKQAEKFGIGGIIHFDVSRKNINKVVRATVAVLGDLSETLPKLEPHVEYKERKSWLDLIKKWKTNHPFGYVMHKKGHQLKPQYILEMLNTKLLKEKKPPIITTGVGQHQMWTAQYIRWRYPRSFITSGGLGTMGYGLPAAMGAKIAYPDRIVIDIDGDASFAMTLVELMTAAEFNIGVKVLILNNHFQGMVKQWQDLFFDGKYAHTEMTNPDFAKIAEASGVKGMTLNAGDDIDSVLEEFLRYEGPVVLNAIVEKDEHVYPMVPSGAALHEMKLKAPETADIN